MTTSTFTVDVHLKMLRMQDILKCVSGLMMKSGSHKAPCKGESDKPSVSSSKQPASHAEDKYFLQDAQKGAVVTRFPPEASGYLHIGHAKAALINHIVSQKYDGKLIFRFDDTNPDKEKIEYEESIEQDLKWLGIDWIGPTHTSDYFPQMISLATQLIEKGHAYADSTPADEMRKCRERKCATLCRENTIEENMRLWNEMKSGSEEGKRCCLRAKIDFKAPNGALRDPTIYRVVLQPAHVRTGTLYKVYPTYDFACPIVDSLEGVTHALRTTEYKDRDAQYKWFAEALEIRCPQLGDYSRLNMEYTVMSKRKLTELVSHNIVSGWDDPRFPTVRALSRKGLTTSALREFVEIQGMSKVGNYMEWSKLWTINARILDPTARRYTAVSKAHSCLCTIQNYDGPVKVGEKMWHKKNPSLGSKSIYYGPKILLESFDVMLLKEGEEITLMDWGNAFIENIKYPIVDGQPLTKFGPIRCDARLHLEGDFKNTKYKLSWIANAAPSVLIKCVEFDQLLTVKKIDSGLTTEEFLKLINTNSRYEQILRGEEVCASLEKGQSIQIERRGFYIVDEVSEAVDSQTCATLLAIPDGRKKINHLSAKAVFSA